MFVQFVKFAGVGVIGTLSHYTVLVLLVQLLDVEIVLSSSIGAIVGAMVNYSLNYRFTFSSNKRHKDTLWKFFAIAGVGFLLNALMMFLLADILKIFYLIAQIISTASILVWNFLGNRFWTFHEGSVEPENLR